MALREDDSDLVPVAQYYFGRPTARDEYTGTLSCAHLPESIRAGRGATHLAFELAPQRLVQRRGYGLELRHVSLLPQLERPFCLRAARKMPLAHACYPIPPPTHQILFRRTPRALCSVRDGARLQGTRRERGCE